MENIIKEIDLKIKEIVQSEEIDTRKLTELINTKDRLKECTITTVSQIQGFNQGFHDVRNNIPVPAFPIQRNNQTTDSLIDVANVFLKNQKKQVEFKNIHDLISYYRFISELEMSTEKEINNERFEIKTDIENLIIKEFRSIIKNAKDKEKQQGKDKIIETLTESKLEE